MCAERLIEFAVIAKESLDTLGKSASRRIEVLPERARNVSSDLGASLREQLPQTGQKILSGSSHGCGVELARSLPKGKDAKPKSTQGVFFARRTVSVLFKFSNNVRIGYFQTE